MITMTMRTRRTRRTWLLPSRVQVSVLGPYRQAAIAYAVYGVVYLVGAVIQLTPDRQVEFFGFVPWWTFYVVGAALILSLPILVWRRYRRFTQVLSFFPVLKAMTLLVKQGRLMRTDAGPSTYNWVFAAVALAAGLLLFRAGFGRAVNATSEE